MRFCQRINWVFVAVALYSSVNGSLFAQNTEQTNVYLSEIQVSANRIPSVLAKIGRSVTVITKSQLAELSIQSVDDILEYASSVDVRQRGPLGIQSDVSLRGGSFDQVMILLNGINVTDPQTGHFSMNLPISINDVERVEIIEGSGSRVFGPNAFSGAVNIVTNTQGSSQLSLNADGGEFGYLGGGAKLSLVTNSFTHFATGRYSQSDGYQKNTDFDQRQLYYHSTYKNGLTQVDFQTGYFDKSFGAFAFYSPKYPNQYEQNSGLLSSLTFSNQSTIKSTSSVYWRRHNDRWELDRENISGYKAYHLTDVFGGNLNFTIPSKFGKSSVGADVRSEMIWSSSMGDLLISPIDVPGEKDAKFIKSYTRTNSSLFIEHQVLIGQLSMSGGLLINHNSSLSYRFDVFPGLDLSYYFSKGIKVYASVNQSLRMPTFTDLFSASAVAVGNRDLKPEEVTGYELGVHVTQKEFTSKINGFYRDSKNLIDWGRLSVNDKYQSLNISQMNSYGLQISFDWTPENFANGYVKKLSVDYLYLNQDRKADLNYDSRYILDYLKHKIVATAGFKIWKSLGGSYVFHVQDREGYYTDATDIKQDYKLVSLSDIRLSWTRPQYRLYADVVNCFNAEYQDIGNVPQPGRWVKFGASVTLWSK